MKKSDGSLSAFQFNSKNQLEAFKYLKKEWKNRGLVFFYARNSNEQFSHKETFLSPEELSELNSITIESRRNQYLTSRWMLKILLGELLNIKPNEISFIKSALGKPQLLNEKHSSIVSFNISHKTSISVIGITNKGQIGIDVEEVEENDKSMRIAERYFSVIELAWINQIQNQAEQNLRFYKVWSMKEAIIKAVGGGIFQNLNDFYIESQILGFKIKSQKKPWSDVEQWDLFEITLPDNLIGSVAIYNP